MTPEEKIKDHESFFSSVLSNMKENSVFLYSYEETNVTFQKINGHFVGTLENFLRVKELVSIEFLDKHFNLKSTNHDQSKCMSVSNQAPANGL